MHLTVPIGENCSCTDAFALQSLFIRPPVAKGKEDSALTREKTQRAIALAKNKVIQSSGVFVPPQAPLRFVSAQQVDDDDEDENNAQSGKRDGTDTRTYSFKALSFLPGEKKGLVTLVNKANSELRHTYLLTLTSILPSGTNVVSQVRTKIPLMQNFYIRFPFRNPFNRKCSFVVVADRQDVLILADSRLEAESHQQIPIDAKVVARFTEGEEHVKVFVCSLFGDEAQLETGWNLTIEFTKYPSGEIGRLVNVQ